MSEMLIAASCALAFVLMAVPIVRLARMTPAETAARSELMLRVFASGKRLKVGPKWGAPRLFTTCFRSGYEGGSYWGVAIKSDSWSALLKEAESIGLKPTTREAELAKLQEKLAKDADESISLAIHWRNRILELERLP